MKLHIRLAEKRMTQKQLAQITGIRLATISGYCNDNFKHIVAEHLNIFCTLFQCTPADLIEYKPDEYNDQDFTELANAYEEASKDYKFK
jgi:putative transcriptional regulator